MIHVSSVFICWSINPSIPTHPLSLHPIIFSCNLLIHPLICIYIHLHVYVHVYLSIHPYIHPFIHHVSISHSVHLSIQLSIYPFIYMCLFAYRVAVSRSCDVPYFGPPIPESGTFQKSEKFRNFLLTKRKMIQIMINFCKHGDM